MAGLIQRDVSFKEFEATVNQMVLTKRLTPEISKLKLADYKAVKGLREMSKELLALQGNNATPSSYAEALKRFVQAGAITPEEAAQLMQEYLALTGRAPSPAATGTAETEAFARLQQQVQAGAAPVAPPAAEFAAAAETQADTISTQERMNQLQNLMTAMSAQAGQLITAWQPPIMQHRAGSPDEKKNKNGKEADGTQASGNDAAGGDAAAGQVRPPPPPLIKSGTMIFAVLDTQANSDYPDSPIMATVVEGKYKGARLLGKLVTAKGVAGQMDRISLNFSMMNMEEWTHSKNITAYAIDPDTARTVMASDVNYHYLKRFGAIMATSFLQGYATAITTSGATGTTGTFGSSTTNPQLDPRQKIMVGLGQMGQQLGQATQQWINIPPTVRVDPGVGLGILFMADVT